MSEEGRHVDIAVPVPLRKTFTYWLPERLAELAPVGSRVAVPFGRRKLAGFVLGGVDRVPEGTRIKEVAGVLDSQPVFTEELLGFLRAAADYYLHPLGEVLRAAAPALPTEAMKALQAQGFLQLDEHLPGSRLATRQVEVIKAGPALAAAELKGKNQRVVQQLLAEREEVTVDELRRHLRSPAAVVKTLRAKNLIENHYREVPRDRFFVDQVVREEGPTPNPSQVAAIDAISDRLGEGGAFLVHGVTGSGKTEVYLRVIASARARGLGALMLVPEIALTPQLVGRFRARFGDEIAVLHSELSARERDDAWRGLRQGRFSLVIGARSALFAPIENLGVIVVDEEHDPSFKQEEGFRYQARDMAILRAHRTGAVCILGSATPSLESLHLGETNKLVRLVLAERATGHSLPPVELVDLNRHRSGPTGHRLLTGPLHSALRECLEAGDQAILFLNRRGFAPSVRCETCGVVTECPSCSVALTLHRGIALLRCHYCDFSAPANGRCLACKAEPLVELGLGTEQLEHALAEDFPEARVGRLDRDTASGRGVEAVLDRLRKGKLDVLVGTQMVTKGHDIPGVTLVGVILADQSLAFPDFRASERTFQLLTQVAGRAGRGDKAGRVVLQTYQPEHPAVHHARTHDYEGFSRVELADRRELGYPPYSRLLSVRVDAGGEPQARKAAEVLARVAREHRSVVAGQVKLMGPAPAPIFRLRNRYRFRFMLRSTSRPALREVAARIMQRIDAGIGPARAALDVDPVSML